MDFPYLDCSRVQSDFSFLLWNSYRKLVSNWKQSSILHIVFFHHKNVHFCSSCRIQSDNDLPFEDFLMINLLYTKTIAKINDQNLFEVKMRIIADISNKRRKINKSSISSIFFIKLFGFSVCQRENADI